MFRGRKESHNLNDIRSWFSLCNILLNSGEKLSLGSLREHSATIKRVHMHGSNMLINYANYKQGISEGEIK